MILFFREPNGDYLNIVSGQFVIRDSQRVYDSRATAIAGLPTSMCTAGVGETFLKTCKRVAKRNVPREWLRWMGWDSKPCR